MLQKYEEFLNCANILDEFFDKNLAYVKKKQYLCEQTIVVPNNNQLYTFNFVLDYPSAVVFYLVKETAQPAGAPVRRAKKDNDDPLGEITSIAIDRQEIVTGIESISHDNQLSGSQKILRDGRLLILRDGKIFDVTGQRVK